MTGDIWTMYDKEAEDYLDYEGLLKEAQERNLI